MSLAILIFLVAIAMLAVGFGIGITVAYNDIKRYGRNMTNPDKWVFNNVLRNYFKT